MKYIEFIVVWFLYSVCKLKCDLIKEDFCGDKGDGFYAHPTNCIKDVACLQGMTFPMACPMATEQLYFDEEKKVCNKKQYAKCSVTTTPASTTQTTVITTTVKATTKTLPPPSSPTIPKTSTTLAPGDRTYEDAVLCNPATCKLPACHCASDVIPGGLTKEETPQMILFTMDDAVQNSNFKIYKDLLSDRKNPNGCPIKATFFVSHKYTDYNRVAQLHALGHEIADHSLSSRWPDTFWREGPYEELKKEIVDQKKNLETLGYAQEVRGWRSPYLRTGEHTFKILADNNFLYDSSLTTNDGQRWWPYTLDHITINYPDRCPNTPVCRKKAYPNLWEIPINSWKDGNTNIKCGLFDACFRSLIQGDLDSVYNLFKTNYNMFHDDQKQPFTMFGVGAYFDHEDYKFRREGFKKFVNDILTNHKDTYFVSMKQAIAWMQNPTKLEDIKAGKFKPWNC